MTAGANWTPAPGRLRSLGNNNPSEICEFDLWILFGGFGAECRQRDIGAERRMDQHPHRSISLSAHSCDGLAFETEPKAPASIPLQQGPNALPQSHVE
jgi:hypothetical protein